MGDLLIRGLDPETEARLAARAKANRRSISAEAADILSLAIDLPDMSAGEAYRRLRERNGPVDFEPPPRPIEAPRVDFE